MELKSPEPQTNALSPIWKFSPSHNGGSNLLDSYELQAVTKQLNRAIRASNGLASPYSGYLKSPFYLRRLDRMYKENTQTCKKISCSNPNGVNTNDGKGTTGFVLRLWQKVKQGLTRANRCNR